MASSSSAAELEEDPQPIQPSWAVLSRVAKYTGEDPGELFLKLAMPPHISLLTIPSRFSEPPKTYYYGDGVHPYIVAANDAGLLLHVSPRSRSGFNLGPEFRMAASSWRGTSPPADGTGMSGELTATTVRVADRELELSQFSGVKSVGLLPVSAPSGFVVAELQVVENEPGRQSVNLIWFRFSAIANAEGKDKDDKEEENSWRELVLTCPVFTPGDSAQWDPHDVVAFDGKLWWADLSRGLLVCNPVEPGTLVPQVSFVALPDLAGEMFVALQDRHEDLERIDSRRIVRVSGGRLRFVDVVRRRGDPPEATRVVVWTLESAYDPEIGRARWEHHQCITALGEIWGHASYVASGMPREFPELAFLDPDKHSVVYFFLDAYLFSVDVNESAVVEFAAKPRGDVVQVEGGPQPINWRYVIAWVVPRFKMVRVLLNLLLQIGDSCCTYLNKFPVETAYL
ncbi:unnamed protein product [Urochloa decumbens]|uniref:DUF1618 domain-containing protein n=1 Tax=Urochloa decumbens TaxID=240449 RepID=A0ABC9A0T4_9POAL